MSPRPLAPIVGRSDQVATAWQCWRLSTSSSNGFANVRKLRSTPWSTYWSRVHACWKCGQSMPGVRRSLSTCVRRLRRFGRSPANPGPATTDCCWNVHSRRKTISRGRSSAPSLIPNAGVAVSVGEGIQNCGEILNSLYDNVPIEALYFSGDMAEIRTDTGRPLTFAPVKLRHIVRVAMNLPGPLLNAVRQLIVLSSLPPNSRCSKCFERRAHIMLPSCFLIGPRSTVRRSTSSGSSWACRVLGTNVDQAPR